LQAIYRIDDNVSQFNFMDQRKSSDKIPAAEPVVIGNAQESEKAVYSPVSSLQKREDGTDYPSGLKLFLIILALCLGVFLMALGMLSSSISHIVFLTE
jgi:hypothetical protein